MELRYTEWDVFLWDMTFARRRLGWPFIMCDDLTSQHIGFITNKDQNLGVHFLLPVTALEEAKDDLLKMFKTLDARQAFLKKVNEIPFEPYEPARRTIYDRVLEDDLL